MPAYTEPPRCSQIDAPWPPILFCYWTTLQPPSPGLLSSIYTVTGQHRELMDLWKQCFCTFEHLLVWRASSCSPVQTAGSCHPLLCEALSLFAAVASPKQQNLHQGNGKVDSGLTGRTSQPLRALWDAYFVISTKTCCLRSLSYKKAVFLKAILKNPEKDEGSEKYKKKKEL